MAEIFIRWVKGLSRRREVLVLARQLGMSRREAACCCMEVWEWADDETGDGVISGAKLGDVDQLLGVPGFARAMCAPDVGWLVETEGGICFPRWSKNNEKSAKKREYERRKKREQRKLSRAKRPRKCPQKSPHVSTVTNGDKNGFPLLSSLPLPIPLKKEEYERALEDWLAYKRGRGEDYEPRGLKAMLTRSVNLAAKHGLPAVIDAMERAMANNWAGWDQPSSFSSSNGRSSVDPRGNLAAAQRVLENLDGES